MAETKICSHCNQEIEDEDNLILCASCQKPYHKKCWVKCKCYLNCTIENNTIENISEFETVDWNEEKNQIQENNENCIDLSEEEKYVGYKNWDYYRYEFTKIKEQKKVSFNFAAAFFQIYWFCYRKLYIEALILTGIYFLANLILGFILIFILALCMKDFYLYELLDNFEKIFGVISFITQVLNFMVIGSIANKLYFYKIARLKNKNKDYKFGRTSAISIVPMTLAIYYVLGLIMRIGEFILQIIF